MADVIVYNKDKVDALTGQAVIGATINPQGELILSRLSLPDINIGRATPEITIDDLLSTTPFYIAHRGSGDEIPEHTIEAYRYAVAAGAKAIEVSVQSTADGVLVCFHDTTLARMTGGTAGAVSDYTYAQLKNMIKVKGQGLLGPNWPDLEIPLFRKVIEEFYKNVVIFVEPKDTASTVPLQTILNSLENSTASIVYKSHINATSGLTWAKANGYKTWGYTDPTTTSAQMDAVDSIVDYWGVPFTATDAQISMAVAHSPVKPVIVWEVHRRDQRNAYSALGVKGMMTSGYSYVTRTTAMKTKTNFDLKIAAPGNITVGNNSDAEALKFFGTNEVGFIQQPNRSVLLGSLCPITNRAATYTIAWEMMFPILPAVAEHAGIAFGKVSDDVYTFGSANKTGGYHVLLRGDGDLQLYTHTAGVGSGTQIGSSNVSVPDPANPVAGVWMSFNVVVTPTNITVNRTDVAKTFTVADTTYRGGYIHLLAGNVADATKTARFRNVVIT
jgi:glycerophosphoryl diester phosphodiesterase